MNVTDATNIRLTGRGKVALVLGILATLAVVAAGVGYIYLRSLGVFGGSDPGRKVRVVIPEGATASEVGRILEDEGVIRSALGWRIALYLEGGAPPIEAGRYELREGLAPRDALAILERGAIIEFVNVTFPEGSWLTDFARILDDKTHVSGDRFLDIVSTARVRSRYLPPDVHTLEGLLFPSTYQIVERDTAMSVARRLVDEFEKQVADLDFTRAQRLGVTPYEAIIVASMVEAEAKVPEERAKIARVIYNRLDEGIPLGIDATVNYAIGEHRLDLTRSELAVDSPYNTRVNAGLPPTPIGAPGAAAIAAALEPADGAWLYYVLADCEGHHAFSESYSEFLDNKAAYQELEC